MFKTVYAPELRAAAVMCQDRTAAAKGDFGEAFMAKHFQQVKENQCMQCINQKTERSCFSSWVEQKHWLLKNNLNFLDQVSIYFIHWQKIDTETVEK